MPAIDPEVVAKAMQQIRDRIRGLEDRKGLLEQQELLVRAARPDPPEDENKESVDSFSFSKVEMKEVSVDAK